MDEETPSQKQNFIFQNRATIIGDTYSKKEGFILQVIITKTIFGKRRFKDSKQLISKFTRETLP